MVVALRPLAPLHGVAATRNGRQALVWHKEGSRRRWLCKLLNKTQEPAQLRHYWQEVGGVLEYEDDRGKVLSHIRDFFYNWTKEVKGEPGWDGWPEWAKGQYPRAENGYTTKKRARGEGRCRDLGMRGSWLRPLSRSIWIP